MQGMTGTCGALIGVLAAAGAASANTSLFEFIIEGAQEVPMSDSEALGVAALTYYENSQTFDIELITGGIFQSDLLGVGPNDSPIHIHMAPRGSNGPIVIDLGLVGEFMDEGFGIMSFEAFGVPIGGPQGNVPASDPFANEAALFAGDLYLNIHTNSFPGGEIRGQIPVPATTACLLAGGVLATRRRR